MINEHDGQRTLTHLEMLFYFIAGLCINATGNGLTVATNLGSAPWTAAAANLSAATHLPIDLFLFSFGFGAAILVILMVGKVQMSRFIKNMIFVFLFSVLVGFTTRIFIHLGVTEHIPYFVRLLLDFIGISMIATGISITQRLAVVLHSLDDWTNVMRFKYFHGNVVIAQTLNFAIPILISLTVWLISGKLVAINIGTIFSFICQGYIISQADQHIFPKLVHKTK